jgi:hypothetical protein
MRKLRWIEISVRCNPDYQRRVLERNRIVHAGRRWSCAIVF